ncbi:MAG: MBOAT family protein [Clostridia bacterium]|nr:MBOAT family protein [Clostridia bacterium]
MQTDQLFFIFAFLPLCIAICAAVPQKFKPGALALFSLVFAAWGRPADLVVILSSSFFTFFTCLEIEALREKGFRRLAGLVFAGGFAGVLGFLVFYKYLPGAVSSLSGVVPPVGLSFITFSLLSYLFDVFSGKNKPSEDPVGFLLFVLFFPKLISGPIVSCHDFADQLSNCRVSAASLERGLRRFVIGLAKKLLIANALSVSYYALSSSSGARTVAGAWLALLFVSFMLYYDFSGYSDMAVGLGAVFGFELPENFLHPYACDSMTGFWRSWHASLGRWFRDYVYIPLGGSRGTVFGTLINMLCVWVLTGFWHGGTLTFFVWGMWHFVLLALEKFVFRGVREKIPRTVRVFFVFLLAIIGWVPFFSSSLGEAVTWLSRLFGAAPLWDASVSYYLLTGGVTLAAAVLGCGNWTGSIYKRLEKKSPKAVRAVGAVLLILLFAVCTAIMTGETYSSFLYAGF